MLFVAEAAKLKKIIFGADSFHANIQIPKNKFYFFKFVSGFEFSPKKQG